MGKCKAGGEREQITICGDCAHIDICCVKDYLSRNDCYNYLGNSTFTITDQVQVLKNALELADKEIERLTQGIKDIGKECTRRHDVIQGLQAELDHYKQAEAEGRLVALPCSVGDAVWTNRCVIGDYTRDEDKPYSCKVRFVGLCSEDGFINIEFKNGRQLHFPFSDIGKTVFTTKEQAEQALQPK